MLPRSSCTDAALICSHAALCSSLDALTCIAVAAWLSAVRITVDKLVVASCTAVTFCSAVRDTPSAAALDYQLRLIQLDVSDPARPVRVAQVDLEGEPWGLAARDGALWVATRRRIAEQRGCDADLGVYSCVWPAYEALVSSAAVTRRSGWTS